MRFLFIVFAVGFFTIGLILLRIVNHIKLSRRPDYELRPSLLTPAERSYFGVLEKALGGEYRIFSKVRLADLVQPRRGHSESQYQGLLNKLTQKHIDFVLCDPETLAPRCLIELNDRSHFAPRRARRDEFLRKTLEPLAIAYLRVPARAGYVVDDVRAAVEHAIGLKQKPKALPDKVAARR